MKTGKRSYPLDQLSVSEDGVSVSIHTHRQMFVMSVVVDGFGEHRLEGDFNDLLRMVTQYIKKHDCGEFYASTPSGVSDAHVSIERSRSTGVEEGR